nr:2'-deoxycytidine 5'-triphosphate deaminase [Rhizobium tropici]
MERIAPSKWLDRHSLIYEHRQKIPSSLYGSGLGSNYQAQGLKLSKHFRL